MVDRINNQRFYDYSKVSQQKRDTTEAAEFKTELLMRKASGKSLRNLRNFRRSRRNRREPPAVME